MMTSQQRISTGNPQADEILGGGFPANSINIIMGQPGTGKSIFAEQLVFRNAGDDRPILYFTTLSEPLAKMVGYLQRFTFFDEEKLGKSVVYEDIGPQLVEGGIRRAARRACSAPSRPRRRRSSSSTPSRRCTTSRPSPLELRRILYELTGLLTAFETTVFLIGEYTDEDAQRLPEFAVADGIVQFMRNPLSTRDERFLRVLKLRGSAYLEGLHAFRIGAGGLEIFPRLVSPEIPESYTIVEERTATGIEGLDRAPRRRAVAREHDAARRPDGRRQDDRRPAVRPRGRAPRRAVPLRQLPGEPDAARPLACGAWAPTSRTSSAAACT